jgi:hypothetical protein
MFTQNVEELKAVLSKKRMKSIILSQSNRLKIHHTSNPSPPQNTSHTHTHTQYHFASIRTNQKALEWLALKDRDGEWHWKETNKLVSK